VGATQSPPTPIPIVALCGGVGAARFLRGLVTKVDPADVVAIVNTGDDRLFYGVHTHYPVGWIGFGATASRGTAST
jgi:hypothetical protein